MVKLLTLASLLLCASAFTHPSHRLPAVGLRQAFASTSLPQALPDWAHEDSEGTQSEKSKLDISQTIYTSSFKKPLDAYIAFAEKGAGNSKMSKHKILHQVRRRKKCLVTSHSTVLLTFVQQAILGGAYVGFGGLLSLCIAGNLGGMSAANPGIAKMAFAALFPVNLLLCVTTGGQLFTGNTATGAAAKYEGLITMREYGKSLAMSLLGNVIGCLAFAWAAHYVGILSGGAADLCTTMALGKCKSTFGQTVVKAILCNWMVSLAVFLSGASNDLCGKLVGVWFPISTFVGIGLEHSVANLFIFPAALFAGAHLTAYDVLIRNVLPVIFGNIIAGAFVVAGSYSYQFGNLGKSRREHFQARQAVYEEVVDKFKAKRALKLRLEAQNPGPFRRIAEFVL